MQISFCLRKLRSTSKEDVDLFLYWEKLRSTSYQDADLFLYGEKFRSTSYQDADLFLYWEKFTSTSYKDVDLFFVLRQNLDLHLIKMQICFFLRKIIVHMQIYWHSRKRL